MLGKVIAAVAGKNIAERVSGGNAAAGAALGVVAATVVRRMGPLGVIAALAGGYALKKRAEKKDAAAAATGPVYGAAPG